MAKKKELDNIERDVIAAMRLGYGVHYGWYKADYPHTREKPLPEPRRKELPAEEDAVCVVCGKRYLKNHGCQKYCSQECAQEAEKRRNLKRYRRKLGSINTTECPVCGKEFLPVSRRQKYCDNACAVMAANQKKRERRIREEKHEKQALAE